MARQLPKDKFPEAQATGTTGRSPGEHALSGSTAELREVPAPPRNPAPERTTTADPSGKDVVQRTLKPRLTQNP